jgi:endonuclease-3
MAAAKKPFDIDEVMRRLREAVSPYPKAALFELAAEGHTSVFEILVACIISIRTRDETTLPVARRLFARAPKPADLAALSLDEIDELIRECTFHEPKARTIRDIAQATVKEHDGVLPCDREVLLEFHGVGPKCANLALGIACNLPLIGVDVHVHRVANRWGYVETKTPEKTMAALQEKLPRSYWVEINALVVPFGKHLCTGDRPKCSTCPLLEMCQQVGVKEHR